LQADSSTIPTIVERANMAPTCSLKLGALEHRPTIHVKRWTKQNKPVRARSPSVPLVIAITAKVTTPLPMTMRGFLPNPKPSMTMLRQKVKIPKITYPTTSRSPATFDL